MPGRFKPLAQNSRPAQRLIQFVAPYQNVSQRAVWRIVHPAAKAQFFFVEAHKIMLRSVLNRVVIREISLQYDFTWSVAATGPSFDLGQQLESSFGRPKVRKAESHVGSHHANQCDSVNIVALGDHLRAHQHIEFAFIESVQCTLEVLAAADGVAIETSNARLRKHSMQQLFKLFRARAEKIYVLT